LAHVQFEKCRKNPPLKKRGNPPKSSKEIYLLTKPPKSLKKGPFLKKNPVPEIKPKKVEKKVCLTRKIVRK